MIAIMDYGVGNLRSVQRAIEKVGGTAVITTEVDAVRQADALVLPGVGAFGAAMERLKASGFVEEIKRAVELEKPFLGICLGMQLLFDYSEEGGSDVAGLGILPGSVRRLPAMAGCKVPQIGWNSLSIEKESQVFRKESDGEHVYFVHSYYVTSKDRSIVTATTEHGIRFDAAVSKGQLHGAQFHPEKSGAAGLELLRRFVEGVKVQ